MTDDDSSNDFPGASALSVAMLRGWIRRPRNRSLAERIKRAKKAGATSLTMPDGITYAFGEPAKGGDSDNEVETWIRDHAH